MTTAAPTLSRFGAPLAFAQPSAPPRQHHDGWIDFLFALALAAVFFGQYVIVSLPGTHIQVKFFPFLPLIVLTALIQWVRPQSRNSFVSLWSWTVFLYVLSFVAAAFRWSYDAGLKETLSQVLAIAFVLAFAQRYSVIPLSRFLKWFIPLAALVMAWNIGWHLANHFYVSWKRLDNPKALFNVMPLLIIGWAIMKRRTPYLPLLILLAIAGVIILFSGERKAYGILAVGLFLLINPKNPLTYLAPVAAAGVGYIFVSSFGNAYIDRQLATVFSHLTGSVGPQSVSDDQRRWTVHMAFLLWRQHPVFGIGVNGFLDTSRAAYTASEFNIYGIHSEFLRVLTEEGLVGLLLYVLMLTLPLVGVFQRRADGRPKTSQEIRTLLLWWFTTVMYVGFEANKLMLVILQLMIPFLGVYNLTGHELPHLGLRRRALAPAATPTEPTPEPAGGGFGPRPMPA